MYLWGMRTDSLDTAGQRATWAQWFIRVWTHNLGYWLQMFIYHIRKTSMLFLLSLYAALASVSIQKPENFGWSPSPPWDGPWVLAHHPGTRVHALKPELDQALRPRAQPRSSHPYWIPSYPETDKQAMSQHWGLGHLASRTVVSSVVAYWVTCGAFKSYEYHLSPQLIDFDSIAFSI